MVPEYQCPPHALLLVENDIPDSVIKQMKGLRTADWFLPRKRKKKEEEKNTKQTKNKQINKKNPKQNSTESFFMQA